MSGDTFGSDFGLESGNGGGGFDHHGLSLTIWAFNENLHHFYVDGWIRKGLEGQGKRYRLDLYDEIDRGLL